MSEPQAPEAQPPTQRLSADQLAEILSYAVLGECSAREARKLVAHIAAQEQELAQRTEERDRLRAALELCVEHQEAVIRGLTGGLSPERQAHYLEETEPLRTARLALAGATRV